MNWWLRWIEKSPKEDRKEKTDMPYLQIGTMAYKNPDGSYQPGIPLYIEGEKDDSVVERAIPLFFEAHKRHMERRKSS